MQLDTLNSTTNTTLWHTFDSFLLCDGDIIYVHLLQLLQEIYVRHQRFCGFPRNIFDSEKNKAACTRNNESRNHPTHT